MDYAAAAEIVHSLADRFKAVSELSEALKKMGSIENAVKELDKAFEEKKAINIRMTADIEALRAGRAELQASAEAFIAANQAQAANIIDIAKAEADATAARAQSEAAAITGAAHDEAERIIEAAANNARLVGKDIDAMKAELAALEQSRDAALAEKQEAEASTEALRQAAQAVLKKG